MHNRKSLSAGILLSLGVMWLSGCSSPLKYEPRAQQSIPVTKSQFNEDFTQCQGRYRIQRGDSLSVIAEKCNVSMTELASVNNINRPDKIYIGQVLLMPNQTRTLENAKPMNTVPGAKVSVTPTSVKENYPKPSSLSDETWSWPIRSQSEYKWFRDTNGIHTLEIYAPIGEPIYAVAEGEVVYAGDGIREFGKMVMIRHKSGKLSVYAHNQTLLVKEGDVVKSQDKIAELGQSGMTVRPKLHLEARYLGKKIDLKQILTEFAGQIN